MTSYTPHIIGGIIGAILGPLLAIYASPATGLVVFAVLGLITLALWALHRGLKGIAARYGV
jgi:hypothetical protein